MEAEIHQFRIQIRRIKGIRIILACLLKNYMVYEHINYNYYIYAKVRHREAQSAKQVILEGSYFDKDRRDL